MKVTTTLQSRKQELVRDAIYDAAIVLFVRHGFQETTVEDVAQAAGVSRRSFFRYFTTKDHLLAYSIVKYGDVLVSAVSACPAKSSAMEIVHETALAGMRFATSQPRTRQIMEICAGSLPARQAQQSRLVEVKIRLTEAFAARTVSSKDVFQPMMLAFLTLMVVELALFCWFKGEFDDCTKASRYVFAQISRVLSESPALGKSTESKASDRKSSPTKRPRRVAAR
jgi:AcrR family transcriptional regulator